MAADVNGDRSARRSLATISKGETLEVSCILFDGVRAACERAGIRNGERVRCRDATPTRLYLETEGGTTTQLDRRWAQFVEATEAARDGRRPMVA